MALETRLPVATVMSASPMPCTSALGGVKDSIWLFIKVVGTAAPFQRTTELWVKSQPFTVGALLFGPAPSPGTSTIPRIIGAAVPLVGVTTNDCVNEPPPGCGVVAETA